MEAKKMGIGPMLNAYPDSVGGKLSEIVSLLNREEFKNTFKSFYILPSIFNTDLDRGFSLISYDISEKLADKGDIDKLKELNIDLAMDFILNHISVLSPQFQDIIKNGDKSEYKDFFIRGAIFRTCIYASGKSADYAARNLLKKVEGEYLWGPGDITPSCLVLENLSVAVRAERDDIPVLSVGNSAEVNATLENCCKYFRAEKTVDYIKAYEEFTGTFKRWCGDLEIEPDLAGEGVVEEPAICEVKTSPDNCGDDKGTERHNVGYIAYYNKDLFDKGPAPLLLAFHGGGDSSLYISFVSGWWKVAHRNNFLLVAIENHLNSTATEMMELIEELKKKYSIDEHRIYASGFSMGGCKSWDMFQEYPKVFAGLAPMDATFEVGLNVFGKPAPTEINHDTPVPVFYAGGEITPLPELPFQAEKCHDRIKYVFEVNKLVTPYNVKYEDRENWPNKIWGIDGDRVEKFYDETRDSYLTVNYFKDAAGVETTALASISGQGHECREHTCEHAWQFLSKFTR